MDIVIGVAAGLMYLVVGFGVFILGLIVAMILNPPTEG